MMVRNSLLMRGRDGSPIRTCLSCGARRGKEELIRIVMDQRGFPVADKSGAAYGRGAYVCADEHCIEALRRCRKLARAFRKKGPCVIEDDTVARLKELVPSVRHG